ncbi:hypothetical protein [Alicyclobacillus sp. ALC3]|uniref:hypothetical protein n=1 Tax=Alicyclobacillus sp. ALC3 TaxID=2796143 RepID=UPI002377DF97|nr:hypothetical protein [Alicyclobacillus sp. ALC3]WDL96401.1 hypothetical protein JC200_19060 [Alicyclobacillus sp. ALC3]
MPRFDTLHLNRFLTQFSLRYNNADFVNEKLFPVVQVQEEWDSYVVYDQGMMFTIADTKRADGAESTQLDWNFGTADYHAEQYALKDIVTRRARRNADKPLQLDVTTLQYVQNAVMLTKEYQAAQIATNPSTYAASNTTALSGTSQWNNSASTPLSDIQEAQAQIFTASRTYANVIVIPYQVALALAYNTQILDLVKYTHDNILLRGAGGTPGSALLPQSLLGMEVVIAGAGYNTANPGQAASLADVWGTGVILAHVERAPDLRSISFGKTFRTEKYVRKWFDEEREGDWIEYNDIYDLNVVAASTGYLIQDAIA